MPWSLLADVLGLAKGSSLRAAVDGLGGAEASAGTEPERSARHRVAFTMAVIGLCAKMAKSDGVALAIEAATFERRFHIPPGEMENVRRVFDLAKRDTAGFESYAGQIASLLADERPLLRDVLECLFDIAAADGVLHQAEAHFLAVVADRFGIDEAEYRAIRALFVDDPDSPYRMLGVAPDATDAELKARHRALVLEHHPDRLQAHGVPPAFVGMSERRLAAINAAWDVIRKERGL